MYGAATAQYLVYLSVPVVNVVSPDMHFNSYEYLVT